MLDVITPSITDIDTLQELNRLQRRWRSFFPLSEEMELAQRSYDEDSLVRMAYNSNAIEGSTLTLTETEVIYEGEFVSGKPGREQIAARGIFEASAFLEDALESDAPLDQDLIRDLHERCALDLQPRARGSYRSTPAIIRASRTVPLAAHKIRSAIDDLVFGYEQLVEEQGALPAIVWFHAAFERIHPFADGNGRTGRLLMNHQLQQAGFPPITIKVDNSQEYKASLEAWQADDDPEPFLHLFGACLEEELNKRIAFLSAGTPDKAPRPQQALHLLKEDPALTAAQIGANLGISQRQAQRILSNLKADGLIERIGSNKTGHWKLRETTGSQSH